MTETKATSAATRSPQTELDHIRAKRRLSRRRIWRQSRLLQFRAELVSLFEQGASLAEMQLWLRTRHVRVHRSTIHRFITRLPEVRSTQEARDA